MGLQLRMLWVSAWETHWLGTLWVSTQGMLWVPNCRQWEGEGCPIPTVGSAGAPGPLPHPCSPAGDHESAVTRGQGAAPGPYCGRRGDDPRGGLCPDLHLLTTEEEQRARDGGRGGGGGGSCWGGDAAPLTHPSFLPSAADPVVQIEGNPHCCFFNFSPKIMFTKVVKAQLWVYLRPVQHTSTVYLQILRLKPVTEEGSRHIRIRSLKIDLNSRIGHWQSIDFKHVLQNWFKQPQNNWGIEINAFDPNGNDLAVTSLGPGAEGLVGARGGGGVWVGRAALWGWG